MKIIITGGTGFLGYHVTKLFQQHFTNVTPIGSQNYNLINASEVTKLYLEHNPDIVIHLAAAVGGIGANKNSPADFIYQNAMMGLNMIEHARLAQIKKFVLIGTVCSYPKFCRIPFAEEDIFNGYPEETNAPYGIAKRMLITCLQAYKQQYNLNGITIIPVNMYGPRDNFDDTTSHVIPAMIKKFTQAHDRVVLWGTGNATREFVYVEDVARAILLATEHYNEPTPLNIGSGHEISIKDLANTIANLTGYKGKILWDHSKPDGQPRRLINSDKAKKYLNWFPQIDLEDGLRLTIDWYNSIDH